MSWKLLNISWKNIQNSKKTRKSMYYLFIIIFNWPGAFYSNIVRSVIVFYCV